MTLSLTGTRPASNKEWDEVWLDCPYATFFHSRGWAEIWHAHSPGQFNPEPVWLEFSDSKQALLPLSLRTGKFGLGKAWISSPAGTYGGWLSLDTLGGEHARLILRHMESLGNLTWRWNPYTPLPPENHPLFRPDETHTLDLTQGFVSILKNMTKGHRSASRKAENAGVVIEEAKSNADWEAYFKVYESSLSRWGDQATSRYPWSFFETLAARQSDYIRLHLARHEGNTLAGALCLHSRNHVVYWHGAMTQEKQEIRPVNFLITELIRQACERGQHWFDFNPSGANEGVKSFKKSFGTRLLPSPVFYRKEPFLITLARSLGLGT